MRITVPSRPPQSARASHHVFELRLEGGISFGFGPQRPGVGGLARVLKAPDFCKVDPELARYFDDLAKVQWDLSPIDSNAHRMFADESRLVRVIDVAAVTIGVGFVEANATYGCAFVELCLPTTDFRSTGISTFEDWQRILQATKDDLNQEAVLRLYFAEDRLRDADIATFKRGRCLATTDVELEVRPRIVQWSRDD